MTDPALLQALQAFGIQSTGDDAKDCAAFINALIGMANNPPPAKIRTPFDGQHFSQALATEIAQYINTTKNDPSYKVLENTLATDPTGLAAQGLVASYNLPQNIKKNPQLLVDLINNAPRLINIAQQALPANGNAPQNPLPGRGGGQPLPQPDPKVQDVVRKEALEAAIQGGKRGEGVTYDHDIAPKRKNFTPKAGTDAETAIKQLQEYNFRFAEGTRDGKIDARFREAAARMTYDIQVRIITAKGGNVPENIKKYADSKCDSRFLDWAFENSQYLPQEQQDFIKRMRWLREDLQKERRNINEYVSLNDDEMKFRAGANERREAIQNLAKIFSIAGQLDNNLRVHVKNRVLAIQKSFNEPARPDAASHPFREDGCVDSLMADLNKRFTQDYAVNGKIYKTGEPYYKAVAQENLEFVQAVWAYHKAFGSYDTLLAPPGVAVPRAAANQGGPSAPGAPSSGGPVDPNAPPASPTAPTTPPSPTTPTAPGALSAQYKAGLDALKPAGQNITDPSIIAALQQQLKTAIPSLNTAAKDTVKEQFGIIGSILVQVNEIKADFPIDTSLDGVKNNTAFQTSLHQTVGALATSLGLDGSGGYTPELGKKIVEQMESTNPEVKAKAREMLGKIIPGDAAAQDATLLLLLNTLNQMHADGLIKPPSNAPGLVELSDMGYQILGKVLAFAGPLIEGLFGMFGMDVKQLGLGNTGADVLLGVVPLVMPQISSIKIDRDKLKLQRDANAGQDPKALMTKAITEWYQALLKENNIPNDPAKIKEFNEKLKGPEGAKLFFQNVREPLKGILVKGLQSFVTRIDSAASDGLTVEEISSTAEQMAQEAVPDAPAPPAPPPGLTNNFAGAAAPPPAAPKPAPPTPKPKPQTAPPRPRKR